MSRTRTAVFAAVLILAAAPAARGQLDPNAYTSLGTLNHPSGPLTINTDTLTISGAITFTGVALNQNGGPQVAVFDFDSITIGSAATVTLTGSRPLALLSRGNATIQATLTIPTNSPFLGGYAGGYIGSETTTSGFNILVTGQAGAGPGGGGATGGAGGGGYGGKGGLAAGGLGGVPYGNLLQTLQGGSGGGAYVNDYYGDQAIASGGAGNGALEVVAAGTVTVASVSAIGTNGSGSTSVNTGNGTFYRAAGGAGGGILLSGGTGLTVTGNLDVHGGDGSASTGFGNTSAGGGGRIALTGLSGYTLGSSPFSFNLNGGNGAGNGYAGVTTVDALTTFVPGGTSVILTGSPFVSVAGSVTQTAPTIEAYARRDLNVNGTVILGANNAFQRFDANGNNITSLALFGTFDLNGFSQVVDTFSEFAGSPALVKLPAGSTLTVGVGGASNTYVGQITGTGAFVKAGAGTQTLSGTSPGFNGPTTVTGGTLIVGDQALPGSTVTLAGGSLAFNFGVDPVIGALAGSGSISLGGFGFNSLTVGGNNASTSFAGTLSGSAPGGLVKVGTGTWTLTGTNTLSGPFRVQGGTVVVGSTGALSATAPITVSAGATLDLNGYSYSVTSANPLTVQGALRLGGAGLTVASGATATYNGGFVSNGFLRGSGTQTFTGGATLSGITTTNSTVISQTGAGTLANFSNGGALTVAGGLSAGVTFDGFSNQGSGSITVGAGSKVNGSDFETYGTLMLNPGSTAVPTQLTNTGISPLFLNGGSRTFISLPSHANPNQFDAGIDLHGQNAVVAGGLFVNNGYVVDSSNANPTVMVIADFGSLVKGAGFYQNSVQTINGGKFQSGNSPGKASFGSFIFGPAGVSNYVFAIDDATGTAGPSPDANGQVSGWGLVKAVQRPVGSATTPGDFAFTADPAHQLTVALQTLVNPTTVGTDIAGPMADFDPSRPYVWPAVQWAESYSGPASAAALNAATVFDTTGFANPIAGNLGWSLDLPDHSLLLTYTPSAVPEPGTFAAVALAAFGLFGRRRRPSVISCQ
jgi:autotransporter-associated beta strand protein